MIETIINDINYRLDEETKTAEVIKKKGYEGDIIIPETIVFNDVTYRVKSIGDKAFDRCESLAAITIPNSIQSIGYKAFNICKSLKSITIPDSVRNKKYWRLRFRGLQIAKIHNYS